VKGRVRLTVAGKDGAILPITTLHEGDFIGQTALTREAVAGNAYAIGEVTVLRVDRETVEQLAFRKPQLLQDLSQAIDERRHRARTVAAEAEGRTSATDSARQEAS
jgi:CRP-like cAMP-binding protein